MLARNDHHAIAVGHDHVTRTHQDAADRDRPVDRLNLVAPRADAPAWAAVVERDLLLDDLVGVASAPARDDPDGPLGLPAHRVVRADRARVAILIAVDYDHRARPEQLHKRLGGEPA